MSTATRPASSSVTATVTLENPSAQSQPSETLVLRLNCRKKKVTWKEGTVDNEFLQKKSSKKCCIFHKQKSFDEDDSDEEDNHHNHQNHDNETPSAQSQPSETLVLRLNCRKKKVTWKEGTVDNEFMRKKSSKKCCIFHKQKSFDEDDSDEEDNHHNYHDHDNDHGHDHNHGHPNSDGVSSYYDAKTGD